MRFLEKKKFLIMLAICCCLLCISTVRADSFEVIRWLDGFESHTCGDYLSSWTGHEMYPDVPGSAAATTQWKVTGLDDLYTIIDCTKAFSGTQSVEQAWNGVDSLNRGSAIVAYPQFYDTGTSSGPHIMVRPDCTTVVEMDAYFNYDIGEALNNGEGQAVLVWHGSTLPVAGWYAFVDGGPTSKVRYLVGPGFVDYVDSDMPMLTGNQWYHFRTEIYDDFTYSVFITPDGQSTETMVSGVSCANAKTTPPYYNSDYLELHLRMAKGDIYWDNVKVSYVADNAQGFRDIYDVPAGIVINGSLGAGEWSEAVKVAAKPLSGDGVFKSTSTHQNVVLDPNESIDVYSAYDSNNFYVAARFNEVDINDVSYDGSFIEAVFAFDPNVYVYACSAEAASGTTGLITKFVGKQDPVMTSTWNLEFPGLNYADFTSAGGQIAYSVASGVMDVEMKIPFSYMPDFGGVIAGNTVNLQFNVTGSAFGTAAPEDKVVYTTNIGFERYPWQRSNAEIGTPFGAGVAFPLCGVRDNQWPVGDLSENCIVDVDDLLMLAQNWLSSSM